MKGKMETTHKFLSLMYDALKLFCEICSEVLLYIDICIASI